MKQFVTLLLFFFIINSCYCQLISANEFNKQRVKITRESMALLGSWGAVNLIYSGASVGSSGGSDKYFNSMNLIWGGVNFALGTIGYLAAKNREGLSFAESLKKQMGTEKIFLFNAGLDVAYVAGGFYLAEKAKSNSVNPGRDKGYGNSIILQGSALFLLDGIAYLIHQNHGKQLYKLAGKLQVGTTLNGIGCVIRL